MQLIITNEKIEHANRKGVYFTTYSQLMIDEKFVFFFYCGEGIDQGVDCRGDGDEDLSFL